MIVRVRTSVRAKTITHTCVLLAPPLFFLQVYRLNRLLHARSLFSTTLVDCEHLLGRAVEDIALGA